MNSEQLRVTYKTMISYHLILYITALVTRWYGIPLGRAFDILLMTHTIFVLVITVVIHLQRTRLGKNIEDNARELQTKS